MCAGVVCRNWCLQKVAEPLRGFWCTGQDEARPWPCSQAGVEKGELGGLGASTNPSPGAPAGSPWWQRDPVIYWCYLPHMRERLSSTDNVFNSALNKKRTWIPPGNLGDISVWINEYQALCSSHCEANKPWFGVPAPAVTE